MGCSASRSGHDFIHPHNQSNSGSRSLHSCSDSGSNRISRTLSLPTPLVHHPALGKGDTSHLVLLTSSTYGSLVLVDRPAIPNPNPIPKFSSEFGAWMGKSENGTDPLEPLSPDSVVNTWELMEGLDDDFGFHVVESPKVPDLESHEKEIALSKMLKSYEFVEHSDAELPCKHSSEESLLAADSNGGKDLSSGVLVCKELTDLCVPKALSSIESNNRISLSTLLPDSAFQLEGTEDRIVLYYTSLRGIRKTYEECCDVRLIFRGLRVCVDERDISMDSSYRKELQGVLGGKAVSLPQVFIGGRHIGGVNEIKQLNEVGELPKLLKGFPVKQDGFFCGSCGDARFMPCPSCNGSRKVFKNEESKLRRCPDCNENGLIRCPCCCP